VQPIKCARVGHPAAVGGGRSGCSYSAAPVQMDIEVLHGFLLFKDIAGKTNSALHKDLQM
jgi:hypothetical protein